MKKTIITILVLLIIVVIYNCVSQYPQEVHVITYYYVPKSLEDANKYSSYIVKGNFTQYEYEWNMARNIDDTSLEDDFDLVIGKVYNFKVNDVIKGTSEDNINVNLRYSTRIHFVDNNIIDSVDEANGKEIEYVDYISQEYFEPDNNKEYILYLEYDENFDVYYFSFESIAIEILNNDLSFVNHDMNGEVYKLNSGRKNIRVVQDAEETTEFVENISLQQFIELNQEMDR